MSQSLIRILLVDDHEVVLHGLNALLASRPEFEVCGHAIDGLQAIVRAKILRPDLVIMDLSMPGLNGMDASRQIMLECPGTKILVLSMHTSDQLVRELKEIGAHGCVLKSDGGRELVTAIDAIWNGNTFFNVSPSPVGPPRTKPPGEDGILTPREREVLRLLAEGKSNKQVGAALGISVKTAETHRARIMRKLRIVSVADLVRYAIRHQYITP